MISLTFLVFDCIRPPWFLQIMPSSREKSAELANALSLSGSLRFLKKKISQVGMCMYPGPSRTAMP